MKWIMILTGCWLIGYLLSTNGIVLHSLVFWFIAIPADLFVVALANAVTTKKD